MFNQWGLRPEGLKVLDVGCGSGGFTAAIADRGADCTGVEIKPFERKASNRSNLRYLVQDITAPDAANVVGGEYGLVILRDVIEHIPWDGKEVFLKSLLGFMKESGNLLVTFPPYYSPFGLHQQTLLKSGLRKVPGLSLLPDGALKLLMNLMGEPEESRLAAAELKRCRMTIFGFKGLAKKIGLEVMYERYYLFSPSHEIRYGWKTRRAPFGKVPGARELFVMGTEYLLSFK
jgi:SAM-dependent methyltransferase